MLRASSCSTHGTSLAAGETGSLAAAMIASRHRDRCMPARIRLRLRLRLRLRVRMRVRVPSASAYPSRP